MGAFARLVRIGPGETRLALALFSVMLLTSLGAGAGATAADALLYSRYGVRDLPTLYLALGLVSLVAALCMSVVFGAVRRERVYTVALLSLAGALLLLRASAAGDGELVYPLVWLGANVVTILQGIVSWGVASWLCDARQAKRLFPFANAAKILGAIVGAAAVGPLVLVLRLEDLLILWAATLAATFVIVLRLARTAPAAPIGPRLFSLRDELFAGFRIVSGSALLRSLALSLVLFSVLFFALALPFTRAARAALPQEDDLASFLGLFNATTTAAAFVASLLVANRLYARFGVVNAILGFTLIYLAGFLALALTDSFAVIAAARWIQLAWLAGIADAAYQALFNPVPAGRRDQMRAFMEGVPGQAGIALAGLLLLAGDRVLDPRQVALGGALVAILATGVIWRVRSQYRDALVDALRAGRPEPFLGAEAAYASLLRERSALGVAVAGLRAADVATRRASAQILSELAPAAEAGGLLAAAQDADPVVRAFALRGGARLDPGTVMAAARAALDDPDHDLRAAAILVLVRDGAADALDLVRREAANGDPMARAAAAEVLGDVDAAECVAILRDLARDRDASVRDAAARALARRSPSDALAVAEACLDDPARVDDALTALEGLPAARLSPVLRRVAASERLAALRHAGLERSVPANGDVASLLRDSLRRRARSHARRAVRASAILSGRAAPAALLDALEARDERVRAEALETLETYVRPDLARPLVRLWESDLATVDLASLRDDTDPWLRECARYLEHDGGAGMAPLATVALMERVLFLHRVPLFAELDPADLQQVARIATERGFDDGDVLFRQGETGDALYVVTDGSLRIEQDGRQIATRGPGQVVGEMAVVNAVPRIATVTAAGRAKTLRIARADFESILRDRPETALGVIRVLSERLREATTQH